MQQLLSRTPFYQSAPCKCEMRGVSLRDLQLRATGHNRRVSWVSTSQCTQALAALAYAEIPGWREQARCWAAKNRSWSCGFPAPAVQRREKEIPRVPATLAKRMRRGAVLSTAPRLLPNPASRWKICGACYMISRDSATNPFHQLRSDRSTSVTRSGYTPARQWARLSMVRPLARLSLTFDASSTRAAAPLRLASPQASASRFCCRVLSVRRRRRLVCFPVAKPVLIPPALKTDKPGAFSPCFLVIAALVTRNMRSP